MLGRLLPNLVRSLAVALALVKHATDMDGEPTGKIALDAGIRHVDTAQ